MKIRRFASLTLIAMFALVGQAETVQLVLSGDSTLAESLAAYNQSHSTSFVDSDSGASLGTNDIEVSGAGTLSFSRALSGWTGNLTVKSGAKVRAVINETTVLGAAAQGAVAVESGAALILDHSVNVGNGHSVPRTIRIAGDGKTAGESGALKLIGNNASFRSCVPKSLQLDADATICFGSVGSGGQDHQHIADGGEVWNLGGHRLTFTRAGWPHGTRPAYFYGSRIAGGGHIVHDAVDIYFRNAVFEGDGTSTFTVRNGSKINVQGLLTPPKWTLIVEDTASPSIDINPSASFAIDSDVIRTWQGPVSLGQTITMLNDGVSYTAVPTTIGFADKVTGAGGFVASAPDGSDRSLKRFNLLGAGSDFAGGVTLTNQTLHVGAPDSVPAGAGAGTMRLVDSDVLFKYDTSAAADFAFPDTVISGSAKFSAVDCGIPLGHFRSLVKTGTETLNLAIGLTGGDLTVNDGVIRFDLDHRQRTAGLNYGASTTLMCYNNVFTCTDAATKLGEPNKSYRDVAPYVLYRDTTTRSPEIFYSSIATAADKAYWKSKYYQRILTYDGYLQNDSGAAKTIRVICTLNAYVRLTLGDTEYLSPAAGTDIVRNVPATPPAPYMDRKLVIPPGGCRFILRVFERYGDCDAEKPLYYGNVCTTGLTNWDDAHGLMWTEKLDSTDMADYHKFEDTGDGTFFSRARNSNVKSLALDRLSGNGAIDLNGATLRVGTVEGTPNVYNGNVEVLDRKTLGAGRNACFASVKATRAQFHGLETGVSSPVTCYEHPWESTRTYPDAPYKGWQVKDVIPSAMLTGSYSNELTPFKTPVRYDAQGKPMDWLYYQRYVTWNGYIWNTNSAPVTWKVVSVCNTYLWLTIGEKTGVNKNIFDSRGGITVWPAPRLSETFTLQPGPNKFVVKMFDRYGYQTMLHGNVCTNGLTGWTDGHGLMWTTKLESTDMADYRRFEDPGDGSVFTPLCFAANDSTVYSELSGVAGSELDLGGHGSVEAAAFCGVTKVTAGSLLVSGAWTMTREEVENKDVALDGVTFGAGATFDVVEDAALLKPRTKGYVIACNVTGSVCPTLETHLASEGWKIALKDGEVRVMKPAGFTLFFR